MFWLKQLLLQHFVNRRPKTSFGAVETQNRLLECLVAGQVVSKRLNRLSALNVAAHTEEKLENFEAHFYFWSIY
jgi:hypothetical protein